MATLFQCIYFVYLFYLFHLFFYLIVQTKTNKNYNGNAGEFSRLGKQTNWLW
jgi:hypothetical protein